MSQTLQFDEKWFHIYLFSHLHDFINLERISPQYSPSWKVSNFLVWSHKAATPFNPFNNFSCLLCIFPNSKMSFSRYQDQNCIKHSKCGYNSYTRVEAIWCPLTTISDDAKHLFCLLFERYYKFTQWFQRTSVWKSLNISFVSCIWSLDLAMLCDNLRASEKANSFSQLNSGVNF